MLARIVWDVATFSQYAGTPAFNPVIDGTWKNFVTDYGAPTNGTSACDTAVAAYKADANPKLYIPPGSYNTVGSSALTDGRSSAIVSAYGVTFSNLWVGTLGSLAHDHNHSARTNSVSSGTNSVTLKNASLATLWSPGDWALMSGLCMQLSGYPPNFYFQEYVQVLSVVGATITFTRKLKYTYLDTWPDIGAFAQAGEIDLGGPATLYKLTNWDTDVQLYGISCPDIIVHCEGRNLLLGNCNFTGAQGIVPSVTKQMTFHGGTFGGVPEIDKCIENLALIQCSGTGIDIQSGNENLFLHNVCLTGTALIGTFKNTIIQGNTIPATQMRCGPSAYGATETIRVDSSVIPSISKIADARCQIANITWVGGSSGTWKISKSAGGSAIEQFIAAFIPGRKLAYCFFGGSTTLNKDGGGTQTFTCTSQYEDASFFYADTTIGPTQPTPLYGGSAPNYITNWGADTGGITEINSGPADITVFAAH